MKANLLRAVAATALGAALGFVVFHTKAHAQSQRCDTYNTAWGDITKCNDGPSAFTNHTPYGSQAIYGHPNEAGCKGPYSVTSLMIKRIVH
jgi:hypothetical protein